MDQDQDTIKQHLQCIALLAVQISLLLPSMGFATCGQCHPLTIVELEAIKYHLALILGVHDGRGHAITAETITSLAQEICTTNNWQKRWLPQAPSGYKKDRNPSVGCGTLKADVHQGKTEKSKGKLYAAGSMARAQVMCPANGALNIFFNHEGGQRVAKDNINWLPIEEWMPALAQNITAYDGTELRRAWENQRELVVYHAQLTLWRLMGNISSDVPVARTAQDLAQNPVSPDIQGIALRQQAENMRPEWEDGMSKSIFQHCGPYGVTVYKAARQFKVSQTLDSEGLEWQTLDKEDLEWLQWRRDNKRLAELTRMHSDTALEFLEFYDAPQAGSKRPALDF